MRFKRIYVEITNVCNLSCSFCPKTLRSKRFMSVEEFKTIIEQIKPYTKYIYLHIKGEPLLHPNLKEFLDICSCNEIAVNITTNGTLIAKQKELLLSHNAVRQVNISLHSFKAHDGIDTKKYISDILEFAKQMSREKKAFVVMRMWNLDEARETDAESKQIIDYISSEFDYNDNLIDAILKQRSVTLEKGIFLSLEKEFTWPSLKNDYISDTGICYGTRSMLGILVDGTVVPCCLDSEGEAAFGNVFKEGFYNIINSTKFLNAYGGFLNRNVTEELCKRCSYRLRFK